MLQPPFNLQEVNGRQVIVSKNGHLQLDVYNLDAEAFTAPLDQLTMYGNDHGHLLAFVAQKGHTRVREIARALTWYAAIIQNPDLEITTIDPRPTPRLKIVR